MRSRPWPVAALLLACGLLLLGAAIRFPILPLASAGPLARPAEPAATAAKIIRAGAASIAAETGEFENPTAIVLDSRNVRGLLGDAVRSATNEDMGRIVDVIVDRSGITRAAVIDFGGFLGVGSRKIAVDWNAIRFSGPNGIVLDMTRDQVNAAPQYEPGKPVVVLGAAPEFARSRLSEGLPEL